jgi:Sec7-like guanine-nucleotide exchange factor
VDSVYVLAYSLIFLNTLNHNPSVSAARKLTKEQFVKQNLHSNPGFPVTKLEEMFARIITNEFKTDTQYVEKIYERIRAFNHEETTKDTIKRSANILQAGEHFLKFGRLGKPHMRFVYVSDDEECIFWC